VLLLLPIFPASIFFLFAPSSESCSKQQGLSWQNGTAPQRSQQQLTNSLRQRGRLSTNIIHPIGTRPRYATYESPPSKSMIGITEYIPRAACPARSGKQARPRHPHHQVKKEECHGSTALTRLGLKCPSISGVEHARDTSHAASASTPRRGQWANITRPPFMPSG